MLVTFWVHSAINRASELQEKAQASKYAYTGHLRPDRAGLKMVRSAGGGLGLDVGPFFAG